MYFNYLLQAQANNPNAGFMQLGLIVLLVVIFYFFIIRPQSKKQKQIQKAREALKNGDKIITSGGLYGIIREINKTTYVATIEVWDGVKVKVDYNSIFPAGSAEELNK